MSDYTKTSGIEHAVVRWFDPRRLTIVPNVSWGLGVHECDLLVLTKSHYAYEVEIKISRADLLADKKKRHGHRSNKLKRLWFAIPDSLVDSIADIPERAGVLVVDASGRVKELRSPVDNVNARKLSDTEAFQVVRLASLRMWDLKKVMFWRE